MNTHPGPQLAKLLDREIETTLALLTTLEQETQALGRDPEALERAAQRKQELVGSLERLHSDRIGLLQHHGCAASRSGLESFISRFDHGGRLQSRWTRLLELTGRCRDANVSNGAVVELSRLQLRQALAVLHGQSPQTVTYDATGESHTAALSRVLAKA